VVAVADVIDLQGQKKRKLKLEQVRKLEAFKERFHCNHCAAKCAKCGAHGEPTRRLMRAGVTFWLCSGCEEDYQDFLSALDGLRDKEKPFWHNREWLGMWIAWLDYQKTLNNYLNSPEVLLALESLLSGE
jgi:hypothetical protein